jgi:hypothetical protein
MVLNWAAEASIVLFLVVLPIWAKSLGLLQAGNRSWLTCLYSAIWGAVFMMFVYSYVFGFVPGIDGDYQVVAGLGALGGALAGFMFSYVARRMPS